MKRFLNSLWREDDGVLSFEWTVLTSLLTVGVVSGIAGVRDAVVDEMGDLSQAMLALDQSYIIQPPLAVQVHTLGGGGGGFGLGGFGGGSGGGFMSGASGSGFIDAALYADCSRVPMKVQEFPRQNQPVTPGTSVPATEPAL